MKARKGRLFFCFFYHNWPIKKRAFSFSDSPQSCNFIVSRHQIQWA